MTRPRHATQPGQAAPVPLAPAADAPARRRIPAEARRAQVLAVAGELFAREGIDATSMRRIATEAGVTAPLLYRHFADKDALLRALCDAYFVKLDSYMSRACEGLDEPLARLEAVMRAYVACGLDHPHEYELTFTTALPQLRSGRKMREARALRRRGEPLPPDMMDEGTFVFGRLEDAVTEVLLARTPPRPVASRTPRHVPAAILARAAPLSEVIWATGHGLVSLLNTHHEFGFSDRDVLVDTTIELVLNGVRERG
jgi:AcrR family transcriptional regulator